MKGFAGTECRSKHVSLALSVGSEVFEEFADCGGEPE